uniref:Membrane metallo-endopeptidase-like 1 n=1 Tax=Esox lucius TaxID=8010 RepID=A0A6Q2YV42_ESOLU
MGKSESQMDIMEKSTKPLKRRWTVAEIGLSVMLLLVSCALAGLIVLYTSALRERSNRPGLSKGSANEGQQDRSGSSNVCTTPECVSAAARLLQNIDPKVEPCENFYKYACGGWLEHHVIPETSSRHSVFDILRDKLEIVLKGVLEAKSDQDRDAFKKAKTLYNSCMNETLIEQRDSQPLMQLIDSIGDWPVASEDWNSTAGTDILEDTLATLTSQYHKKVLLDMYVWTDDRDSKSHIIYIDQPGLGMPSRDYYFNDGNYKKVREAYLQFMVSIAKIARKDRNLTQDDDRVMEEMESFNFNVSPSTQVILEALSSLKHHWLNMAMLSTCRTMQNYLTWHTVMERVSSLSRRFRDTRAHYRKALYGTTVEDARWRDCVRYVQSSMENAVGALYVRETFAGESKRMVSHCHRQDARLNWKIWFITSLSLKQTDCCVALLQALAIKEHIGYPDHILEDNNVKLDEEYAYVLFPAGILQPPFFSKHQLQALNFGGIGMVIGHEITHGFDDNGRNFDKDGNMLNWWSNYSAEHFKDQSQCMVQQYGRFTWKLAGGQNVSGINTLGENIADNGGVRQAYKAYMKWLEREGEELRLPGLDMDHKQLFFLNFAQVWCGAYRPEYASHSIKTDSHSPLEYRVLGSLQNFGAFSEAFQCKPGTPMNPDMKCRVW